MAAAAIHIHNKPGRLNDLIPLPLARVPMRKEYNSFRSPFHHSSSQQKTEREGVLCRGGAWYPTIHVYAERICFRRDESCIRSGWYACTAALTLPTKCHCFLQLMWENIASSEIGVVSSVSVRSVVNFAITAQSHSSGPFARRCRLHFS